MQLPSTSSSRFLNPTTTPDFSSRNELARADTSTANMCASNKTFNRNVLCYPSPDGLMLMLVMSGLSLSLIHLRSL